MKCVGIESDIYRIAAYVMGLLCVLVMVVAFICTVRLSYTYNRETVAANVLAPASLSSPGIGIVNIDNQEYIITDLLRKNVKQSNHVTKNKPILEVLLPVVVGGLLTLIAVVVTSFLASRREYTRAKFEWGKFLFERYEQYYREFMRSIAGTVNADQISEYFKRLNNSAFVPSHLAKKAKETLRILDSNASAGQKVTARDSLLHDFELFLQKPWGL